MDLERAQLTLSSQNADILSIGFLGALQRI